LGLCIGHLLSQCIHNKYRDIRGKESPTAANHEMKLMSHLCAKLIEWGIFETHPMIDGKFKKLVIASRDRYIED